MGTFFAAMAVRTRFREVMLPLLMIPPLIPVLSASVRATADLLGSGERPLFSGPRLSDNGYLYFQVTSIAKKWSKTSRSGWLSSFR